MKSIREEPSLKTMREEVDDWWREIVEMLAAFMKLDSNRYCVDYMSFNEERLKLGGRFVAYDERSGRPWFELRLDLYAHRPEMSYMTITITDVDGGRYTYKLNLATGEGAEKVEGGAPMVADRVRGAGRGRSVKRRALGG
ncbi:MAG: hypothetical protein ACK4SY_07625 [Pyrobaculum sp.]